MNTETPNAYTVERVPADPSARHPVWYVHRPDGSLLCACAYRRGAAALVEELAAADRKVRAALAVALAPSAPRAFAVA